MATSEPLATICNDTVFWNISLTWGTASWPQFTQCFQNTILMWIPCFWLWLCLPLYLFYIYKSNSSSIPYTFLNIAKMTFLVFLITLDIVNMSTVLDNDQMETLLDIKALLIGYGLRIATFILSLILVWIEKKSGILTSGVQFIFWLLSFLCQIIPFYSQIILKDYNTNLFRFIMMCLTLGLTALELILFCFAEKFSYDSRGYFELHSNEDLSANPCPEDTSSFINKMSFHWLTRLIIDGYKKSLEESDLWDLPKHLQYGRSVPKFKRYWAKELSKQKKESCRAEPVSETTPLLRDTEETTFADTQAKTGSAKPSLLRTLFAVNWFLFVISQLVKLLYDLLQFVSPQILSALISHTETPNEPEWKGYILVLALFASNLLQSFFYHQHFQIALRLGVKIKSSLIDCVYRKVKYFAFREKVTVLMILSDLIFLLFSFIQILKLYAWEGSLEKKILKIRQQELAVLRKAAYLNAFSTFCWLCAPFLVTVATFATYVLLKDDHYIDAQTAFVSLSLFNILRLPINLLPMAIPFLVQAHVAVTRLSKFLTSDEINSDNVNKFHSDENAVRITTADFSWSKSSEPLLKNINLQFPLNKLIAVVGQVGAGKSSLISAILGDMEKLQGEVEVQGSVAYVPQEAWIQNKTVRDNILFGKTYDRKWYEQVIEACALKLDFATLIDGDRTEIGEKGINLSGGQKQRISLARAVYANKDLYILDDPLSAVDAHVGKHIFNMVLSETGLLKSKTRIFVTHGIHWLPKVDKVIVMSDGSVSEEGSYDELISHNGAFAQFLLTYLNEAEDSDPEINEVKSKILQRAASFVSSCSDGEVNENIKSISKRKDSKVSSTRRRASSVSKRSQSISYDGHDQDVAVTKLIQEEKLEKGTVKIAVFLKYARALGLCLFTWVFVLMILNQGSLMFANIWLSQWTDDPYLKNLSNTNSPEYNTKNYTYLSVYGAVGIIQGIIVLVYAIMYAMGTIKAAASMHFRLLDNIIHCPMSFFDTTPIGRIINRFSRDIDIVDNTLAFIIRRWLQIVLQSIGTIIIIGYSTPDFLVVVLPIMLVYYIIQTVYIPSSRQLKRLESTTKSPIYTHFSESISGSSMIRAFNIEQEFIEESRTLVDKNLVFIYVNKSSNRWLGIRLELVGNLIIIAASLFSILGSDITGGLVGLSISYALQVTGALNMLVRMTCDLETNVVSVERLVEYTQIPGEAEWHIPEKRPPDSWPDKGQLEFIDYRTRYRSGLDLVLKGISCTIKPKEKIGIVGRTGAGKSSLTLSLFRIIEADKGCIVIDGHNIANMGLHDLRTKLTILPQDPLIFSGTLRMNLDPLDDYEDNQLWTSLELAHLKKFVETLPNGLGYECGEGGQNLSIGQRQLVCLARALLRKTKVLVLDEATAAVDMETDDLIQKTIRSEFKDCTILTIAHRLHTVIDYDKIMVLDNGVICEFDSPKHLLKNKKSIFYGMAKNSGIVS
ncbi:canalicular multispecific organic anion transporter 2 [Octopus sinensis]|uniref:ABC-type glutathione-S-conjugate transporter n=1 Tax=Octopus sinensis TaxID=2607531 RepID=A0A7E6FK71_9MOLL|nr:canalicular multispecific organic anion transporter 2 [Octopus sinensis]